MRSLWIASALAIAVYGQQPDSLLWGKLKAGLHAWLSLVLLLDSTRRFGPTGLARPILVDIWYPAQLEGLNSLRYRDYLKIPPLRRYRTFASELERFLLDALSDDLFRKKWTKLSAKERTFVDTLLSKPTMAFHAPVPASGRFPLILYHTGAAGSFEENSVLCEYLASYGYAVITSALQSSDGKHVGNTMAAPRRPGAT